MAITGSFSTNTGVEFNLIAYYSYTQDTSANKSTVTVTLKLKHNTINASSLSGSYLSVAGNKVTYSKHVSQSSYAVSETTLATKTVTVVHSSDGKGSCSIKATFVLNGTYSGKYIGTLTLSDTLTLKDIPRASGLSVASSINTGSSLKTTISPSDSSFKHKVRFIVDDTNKYTSDFIAAGTTSFSYTIPHSWSPNKTSESMIVRLYTYTSSGTLVASAQKTVTINVPDNIVPTISSVTATASSDLSGNYVQGKSKVTIKVTAKEGSGSSLTTYYYKGNNIASSDSSYAGTSASKTSSIIQASGSLTYQVRVRDARGRYSAWSAVKITVQPYSSPKISSIKAQRCLADGTADNNGTYAKVMVKTSHSSINGANTATVKLTNSKDGTTATQIISSTNATNTYSGVYGKSFSIDSSYTIIAVITDEYGATHTLSVPLKAAQRSLNIAKYGNGVSIGAMSTVTDAGAAGKFECSWDTDIKAKLNVSGNILTGGDIGCTEPYDGSKFAMYCKWADEANHDILVRNQDGLTVGLGWIGDDTNKTVLDVRPQTVKLRGSTIIKNDKGYRSYANDGETDLNLIKLTGSNNVVIGAASTGTRTGDIYFYSNSDNTDLETLKLGKDDTSRYVQSVPTYERTYSGAANMYITNLGTMGRSTSSSARYKTDITDVINEDLNPHKILNIPVKQFKYNLDNIPIDKKPDDLYIGLIAEDVKEFYPAATEYTEDGQVEMWNIKVLFPALLKVVQDQQKEINALKAEINTIKNQ